jgi:hypothetical protein
MRFMFVQNNDFLHLLYTEKKTITSKKVLL